MKKETEKSNTVGQVVRPPVVVVMGHIDHGKSTLLDYIRKTNVVDKEAGGITQHISAYEVKHKNEAGEDKKITFLDTPGHEAFSKMRARGAKLADIAILVVSAEDSVKTQTLEALQTIRDNSIPFVVAINKIDKPGANPEKTKMDLIEKEVYLEGFGGDTPYVEISAKVGTGINQLLDLILLVADLNEFKAELNKNATGYVLESHLDPKRGISATLIIKDGSIKKGMFVAAMDAVANTRIFENFLGQPISESSFSSPIRITGWDKLPNIGETFESFESKSDAEKAVKKYLEENTGKEKSSNKGNSENGVKILPIIIRADTAGLIEAIEKELGKLKKENISFKVISQGVGNINESDLKTALSHKDTIIVGFNVKADKTALQISEASGKPIKIFDTIYKLTEWLAEEIEKLRPRVETVEITGKAKVQKLFSKAKDKQIMGGKVYEGKLVAGASVKIMRRENEIGEGQVLELQHNKSKVKEVEAQNEFGLQINSKIEILPGDILESYIMVSK